MKVIFLQTVKGVGMLGDTKDVSDGYAMHYLFPRKFARAATAESEKQVALKKIKEEKNALKTKALHEKQVRKLEQFMLQLTAKASAEGEGMRKKLYAQIPAKQIVEALRHKGFDVEEKNVLMSAPIKETGEHLVQIQYTGLPMVTIKVFVKESKK